MTGWEPIVVKPLIILRLIKTVETERDALLRPSEEGTPAPGAMYRNFSNGVSRRDGTASLDAPRSQVPAFPRQD
jgi:hypothetical protein